MAAPLFVFRNAELLLGFLPDVHLPDVHLPGGQLDLAPNARLAGELHDFGDCCVLDWPADLPLPPEVTPRGLRGLFSDLAPETFALAGRAFQLLGWARSHRYCGVCGGPLTPHALELARACAACGATVYPRLNPAVIVLVTRGDEALLSRSAHFQPGVYSCQAGFVGPGESLEEAVCREVREEVGVELADVRYFGSQPWPFPNSLMIGFTATWAGGEVAIDGQEIEDARWWPLAELPKVPARLSIARALIEAWVVARGGDPATLEQASPR